MNHYIVKWVELDDIYNYFPCIELFSEYDQAKNYLNDKEEIRDKQENRMDEFFDGKIISEIYLEVLDIL